MKEILKSTLRHKIQSKVSNSAPYSVSILPPAKAILFGSNALEHKWPDEYVNQSVSFFFYGCYVFSLWEYGSNISKLISLKPFQSQQIIIRCYRQVKGRFHLEPVPNFCNLSNRARACLVTLPLPSYQLNSKNVYRTLNNWKTKKAF